MMKRSSASCNRLADLKDSQQLPNTKLLPICESSPCLHHDELEATKLCLGLDEEEPLYLPKTPSMIKLDEYLQTIPRVASRSEELLSQNHQELGRDKRCVNVLQGEVAHVSQNQADVVVSAEATTCHIVALRSTSSQAQALTSLAHVDGVGYDACLEAIVKKHVDHHHHNHTLNNSNDDDEYGFFWDDDEKVTQDTTLGGEMIQVDVHLLGGFLDDDGASQELSTSLLTAFSNLAETYHDLMRIKISTAAISCMNTCDVTSQPVGRGLGIETSTGKVFICNSVPSHLAGPALDVRSARAFSTSPPENLNVIHDTGSNELRIEPFAYQATREVDILLRLPNETLLKYTSTSPECESHNFCDNLRTTLGFIQRVPSAHVFGNLCDKPLVFARSKSMLNEWTRCT